MVYVGENMNKTAAVVLVLFSLVASCLFAFQPVWAASQTITVPDDYSTIQEAINQASVGDTVYVKSGTYYENIVVNKTVSLLGENREATLLCANGNGSVVRVVADNATISGFTIRNAVLSMVGEGFNGVTVESSNNSIINNIITENAYHGLQLNNSNGNTIRDNVVFLNHWCGIVLKNSDRNVICGNNVTQNLKANNGIGILLQDGSDFNAIENNTVAKNDGGLGFMVSSSPSGSCDNWIRNNSIFENLHDGIFMYDFCQRNRIEFNTVTRNGGGVHLSNSDRNVIVANNISLNTYGGIGFEHSQCNVFFHNNLVGNTLQVWYFSSDNVWDNGYPSGGNYWSDYIGADTKSGPSQTAGGSDGIGDTPHTFLVGYQDRYPLIAPYHAPETAWQLVSFADSFRNSKGESLQGSPIFKLTFPNGTTSPLLTVGTYLMQTGTTVLYSVIWQGAEVMPDMPVVFDAAYGGPTVMCKVYQLTIDPVFYDLADNDTGTLQPSYWSISLPSGSVRTASSSVSYAQAPTGYYDIRNVVLNGTEIASPQIFMWLTSDTVWSPRIGLFTSGWNQTFAFDSNSTLTDPSFNATSQVLSFTASGQDGTSGYVKITFPKNTGKYPYEIVAREDGTKIEYSVASMYDSWLITINYMHSAHDITLDFSTVNIPEFPSTAILTTLMLLIVIVAVIAKSTKRGKFQNHRFSWR
jgi:parallel beta-helix repeat protein